MESSPFILQVKAMTKLKTISLITFAMLLASVGYVVVSKVDHIQVANQPQSESNEFATSLNEAGGENKELFGKTDRVSALDEQQQNEEEFMVEDGEDLGILDPTEEYSEEFLKKVLSLNEPHKNLAEDLKDIGDYLDLNEFGELSQLSEFMDEEDLNRAREGFIAEYSFAPSDGELIFYLSKKFDEAKIVEETVAENELNTKMAEILNFSDIENLE